MFPFSSSVLALSLLLPPVATQAAYDESVPRGYVESLLQGSSEHYFSELNRGWFDEQYAPLKAKIDPRRSYIVLHNRLPSTPLDLRSPNHFRSSVMNLGLLNLGQLDIGHVMLGWHCEIGGKVFEGNTGITGEQENQQKAMANAGWGLTGLFSVFKDGHMQTPVLVRSVFHKAKKESRPIATLAFEVEPEECGQMLSFLEKFLSHENQPFRRFGLNADPLKYEGGGCGSFTTSVISTSGTIPEFFPYVWRILHANPSAFGYGLPNLPKEIEPFPVPHAPGTSRSVGLLSTLLFKNWNASADRSLSIRAMDPEMLFLVQKTIFRLSLDEVYRDSLAQGRKLLASPLVRSRIMKESGGAEVPIDASFDPVAADAVAGAKNWLGKMRARGLRARGFDFNGQPAVLLSR